MPWTKQAGNLRGPAGVNATWHTTAGMPVDSVGVNGDYAIDFNARRNVALGAAVTASTTITNAASRVTDGQTSDVQSFIAFGSGLQHVLIDLGQVRTVDTIHIWRFWLDGRHYLGTKNEFSADGVTWTTFFDSAVSGTYAETAAGRSWSFAPAPVRYIRVWSNGNNSGTNVINHLNEVAAYQSNQAVIYGPKVSGVWPAGRFLSGEEGRTGKTIHAVSAAPVSTVGLDGDFAINATTGALYGPKTAGAWPAAKSLVGPAGTTGTNGTNGVNGANGKTILSTTGAPASGTGVDGDFALDVAAGLIYGPKAAGVWPAGRNIVGATGQAGANGKTILTLATNAVPASGTGTDGDYALHPASGNLYGPKAAGTWPATPKSLIGPAGTNGTNGINGTNGTNGKTILSTTGTPAAGLGTDGDYALDTPAATLYGPKAAGAWPAGRSLVGPAGTNGTNNFSSGTTAARPTAGTADRYYFDTSALVLYRDNGSSWQAVAANVPSGAVVDVNSLQQISNKTLVSPTLTGTTSAETINSSSDVGAARLRLTSTIDAAYVVGGAVSTPANHSSDHAIQIGDRAGLHMLIDNNEIVVLTQVTNATTGVVEWQPATLCLNQDGGDILLGPGRIKGEARLDLPTLPWAMAAMTATLAVPANATSTSASNVSWPGTARFSVTPVVQATLISNTNSSAAAVVRISSLSKDSYTVTISNLTPVTSTYNLLVHIIGYQHQDTLATG